MGFQLGPLVGLGLPHEAQHELVVERQSAVEILRLPSKIALLGDQLRDQMLLQYDFSMDVLGCMSGGSLVHLRFDGLQPAVRLAPLVPRIRIDLAGDGCGDEGGAEFLQTPH